MVPQSAKSAWLALTVVGSIHYLFHSSGSNMPLLQYRFSGPFTELDGR